MAFACAKAVNPVYGHSAKYYLTMIVILAMEVWMFLAVYWWPPRDEAKVVGLCPNTAYVLFLPCFTTVFVAWRLYFGRSLARTMSPRMHTGSAGDRSESEELHVTEERSESEELHVTEERQATDNEDEIFLFPQDCLQRGEEYLEKHDFWYGWVHLIVPVTMSLVWCGGLMFVFGSRRGVSLYVMSFLPIHITLYLGVLAQVPIEVALECTEAYIEQLCSRMKKPEEEDAAAPEVARRQAEADFWVDMVVEYDKLEKFLAVKVSNAIKWPIICMQVEYVSLAVAVTGLGLATSELLAAFGAFGFAASLCVRVLWDLLGLMKVTEMCQSKEFGTNSIIRAALTHNSRKDFSDECRRAHARFLQHITVLNIGMQVPPLGQITREKLGLLLRGIIVAFPVLYTQQAVQIRKALLFHPDTTD